MRLFVAVNFPSSIRDQIWEGTSELRAEQYPIRWVARESLHLTLKFLGDVPHERVAALDAKIARVAMASRPFSMGIEGVGAFPSPGRPNTIWIGCEPVPSLELLQHGVERACDTLGFPLEGRPFRPHITLGRVRKGVERRQLQGIGREMERVDVSLLANVVSVDLMESTLSPSGPRYRVVGSQELVA